MLEPFECEICGGDLLADANMNLYCPLCFAQSEIDYVIEQFELKNLMWQAVYKFPKHPSSSSMLVECGCAICRGRPEDDPIFASSFEDYNLSRSYYDDDFDWVAHPEIQQQDQYNEDDESGELFFSGFLDPDNWG